MQAINKDMHRINHPGAAGQASFIRPITVQLVMAPTISTSP